jgi:ABC-type thiamin/hydroxymethylpyrimidine transport system permease subunit
MATAASAGRAVSPRRYDWKEEFRFDTMDIVVATILGIIEAAIEILGALGFLERTVWLAGAPGFAFYAFYNGTTWILFFAGAYLRKRAGIIVLAALITHVIRWFFGDPDGPILLWYALFPSLWGFATFVALKWRGGNSLFAITCAVTAAMNQVALFVILRGFDLAEGPFWGIISIIVGFLGGLLWGVAGRYLGIGLERAGVPTVEEPPALTGGAAKSYA